MTNQKTFDWEDGPSRPPLVVAYGMGVDSTALLIGLHERGDRPDAILFADTGSEKEQTYEYLPVIQDWCRKVGFPEITVVRYEVKNFKNWPPYDSLETNCLTNGTLPSLAFGFKSCSLKWKVQPQNKWTDNWDTAQAAWDAGLKVRKMIGYDDSGADRKRYSHAVGLEDPKYDYEYPLIEWGWDREKCKQVIRDAGLPVPIKSACYFCPASKAHELPALKREYLRRIVMMEARAYPRLQGHWTQEQLDDLYDEQLAAYEAGETKRVPKRRVEGKGCKGLWRNRLMTDFIREEGLLPADEIDRLWDLAPEEIIRRNELHAAGDAIPEWHDFLEAFTAEDALDDAGETACSGCPLAQSGGCNIVTLSV